MAQKQERMPKHATVMGSISTRGNELFNIFITSLCFFRNLDRSEDRSVSTLGSFCLPCYVREWYIAELVHIK